MSGLKPGQRICRYSYDLWDQDGYLFVKATGIQFEYATNESFYLAARRRARRHMEAVGVEDSRLNGQLAVWDVAHDWATGLPEAITYRTREPVLREALQGA